MAIACVLGAPDHAAARSSRPIEIAGEHYDKANAYLTLGKKRDAIAEFEEAFKWSSQPGMLYNIGTLYRELGDDAPPGSSGRAEYEHAIEYFQRYLGASPKARDRAEVQRAIDELEAKLHSSSAPKDTRAAAPTPTRKSTGPSMRPTEDDSGAPAPRRPIGAVEAERERLRLAYEALVARRRAEEVPWDPRADRIRRIGEPIAFAVADAGLLMLAVGTGMVLGARSRGDCLSGTPCPSQDLHTAGVALVGVGAPLATAGIAFVLWSQISGRRTSRVTVLPWFGAGDVGVAVGAGF